MNRITRSLHAIQVFVLSTPPLSRQPYAVVDLGMRRILITASVVATAALGGVFSFAFSAQNGVGYAQRCASDGKSCWGYQLDQARYGPGTRLTFWQSSGKPYHVTLPTGKITFAQEDRWLANGKAIYLNFRIEHLPADSAPDHVRVIYDFLHGRIRANYPLPLGLADAKSEVPLTDSQFDLALIDLDPTV